MASKELTKQDCTEQQRAFLDALHDEELLKLPAKSRFRYCATKAGYAETVSTGAIMNPIRHLIIAEVEMILTRSALSAAWTLGDIVDGDNLETLKDRLRLDAAKQILDRIVPVREKGSTTPSASVIIMLPAKTATKIIDHVTEDTDD